jgi:outer membrane protein
LDLSASPILAFYRTPDLVNFAVQKNKKPNMMQFKILAAVICASLLVGNARAQTSVTLQNALEYALANSEVVKQARIDIETVAQKVVETKAGALPKVDINSSVTGNILVQQFVLPAQAFGGAPGEFIAIKAGQTWSAMSQVQLSQQIFNKQVFTGLKAAKSSVEFYELSAKMSEENVMQQVAANFYQTVITREKIKVVDANIERIDQLEKIIRGQYENGLAKKIDLDRVLVNKSNVKTQRLELINAISQQENLLKYYMGMPIDTEIILVDQTIENTEIPTGQPLSQEPFDPSVLLSYQVLHKQQELLDFQRQAIVAEAYPTLSLNGNYTYNTQSNRFNLYSGKALNFDASAVSLNLKIPVFDGYSRRARRKQTEFDIMKGKEDIRQTNNNLHLNFSNAQKQLAYGLEAINAQKINQELAKEVFESTQNNYKNGLATLTDLLDAESELVTAQNSYNEALLNYKVAEIELIKSRGEIKSLVNK